MPGFDCIVANLYAPNDVSSRGELWNALSSLKRMFDKPWCIGGDFNEIRVLGERLGCSRRDRGMREFNCFVDRMELLDLPMQGRKFTWCNKEGGERWSRIDRFLIDAAWLEVFNFKVWGLPKMVSDHYPIILREDLRNWGPKPFKFFNTWCTYPDFQSVAKQAWDSSAAWGWSGFKIMVKMRDLKKSLKEWSAKVVGDVKGKMIKLEHELHMFDLQAESRSLSEDEQEIRKKVREEYWKVSREVDRIWLQKSRLDWSLKGDRNTRFFQAYVNSRQRVNMLNSVDVNGVNLTEPARIKEAVVDHFSNLF